MDSHYAEKLRKSPKSPIQQPTKSSPQQTSPARSHAQRNLFSGMPNDTTTASTSTTTQNTQRIQKDDPFRPPLPTTPRQMYRTKLIESPDRSSSCRYIPNRNTSDLEHGFHSPSPKKHSSSSHQLNCYSSPAHQTVKRVSPPIIYNLSTVSSFDGSLIRNGMRSRSRTTTPSPTMNRRRRTRPEAPIDDSVIDDEVRGVNNNSFSSDGDRSSSSEDPIFEMSRDDEIVSETVDEQQEEEEEDADDESDNEEQQQQMRDDDTYVPTFNVGIGGNSTLYDDLLRRELLPAQSQNGSIFRYESTPANISPLSQTPSLLRSSPLKSIQRSPRSRNSPLQRKISQTPYKILDAPGLLDDYYLNLVDWGAMNVLAVGLQNVVYLWNSSTSKVTKLCELDSQLSQSPMPYVTSVSWANTGTQLAVGDEQGAVHLWDITTLKKVRTLTGHTQRVGCLSWNGSTTLSSGSRDKYIIHHDTRSPQSHIAKLLSHKQEVCGLKWSPDGKELASGGNDNKLNVWQPTYANSAPVIQFDQHTAAVKALAWSPHQHGLLASGGGTNDRCIRFWNTVTQAPLSYVDTGSQVCNLAWSENANEIVSTHGYSQNQVFVWKYPSMTPIATLTGHSFRVLYLSVSPDGQNIVTGAGDETLRFWNVFPQAKSRPFYTSMSLDIR